MHFMKGETFMNQEEKLIKVYLEEREKKDYLVFDFDEKKAVCLNSEQSQNELKAVFTVLLSELINHSITLEFENRPDYRAGLYIDVYKEYVKDLNREIENVRKQIPEKLKMNCKG